MAKIGDEKPQTLIAISDKTLKATCLGFHVLLLNRSHALAKQEHMIHKLMFLRPHISNGIFLQM